MWFNGLTEYGLYTKESEKDEKLLVSAFLFGLTSKICLLKSLAYYVSKNWFMYFKMSDI